MSNEWLPNIETASVFLSPSAVVCGRGSSGNVASLLRVHVGIDSGNVLVAVDDAVLNAGLARGLVTDLEQNGYAVTLVSGFGSEPTSEVIDSAAMTARNAGADIVIGMGGGSVLDSSKMLSLLLRNEGNTADWLGVVEPPAGVAPLILIPTTCGTGAEATRIAMVTVAGSKRVVSCAKFLPTIAIIDPNLVSSLPRGVIASTGMDALAHAVEALMSTAGSPMSAHHAVLAIELLVGNLEKAFNGDQDALASCLWGAHLGGQAINAGVVLGHSLAYCLAHEQPMPHGTSCALALPYCIAYNQSLDRGVATKLSQLLTQGESDTLLDAALAVQRLTRRLGLPTSLDEARVPSSTEASMASRCVTDYPRANNPVAFDESTILDMLRRMRSGDVSGAFAVTRVLASADQH